MAGAVLLDLDKPFLYFFGVDPFPAVVQRLHAWIQNESRVGCPTNCASAAPLPRPISSRSCGPVAPWLQARLSHAGAAPASSARQMLRRLGDELSGPLHPGRHVGRRSVEWPPGPRRPRSRWRGARTGWRTSRRIWLHRTRRDWPDARARWAALLALASCPSTLSGRLRWLADVPCDRLPTRSPTCDGPWPRSLPVRHRWQS